MGKYDNLSYSELQKKHKAHMKNKKSQPDESKFKDKDRKMKQSIYDNKLKLAELKYELEQIRIKTEELRTVQSKKNDALKAAQDVLTERKQQTKDVHNQLIEKMGTSGNLKRIANPDDRLKELNKSLQRAKSDLRGGSHSIQDEKKLLREIKLLEGAISEVNLYKSQNVEEIFQKKDETLKNVNDYRSTHEQAYQDFKKARDAASVEFNNLGNNRDEQKKIEALIQKLNKQRTDASKEFKAGQEAFIQWQREKRELVAAMNAKQYDEELDAASTPVAKSSESSSNDAKKAAEAEAEARAEAKEKLQKSVEDRRAAAIDAYKQCQQNLKNKTMAPVSVSSGGEVENAPVESDQPDDPNSEKKALCRSLIDYCRASLPADKDSSPTKKKKKRKKKKNVRLSHKPINFTNFASVDVRIPIWTKDLAGCIKQLEERILSYDNPKSNAEEEVKESAI